MSWKERLVERYGSAAQAGAAVHAELPANVQKGWTRRYLGNQIAKLVKDDSVWWKGTGQQALTILADLLDTTEAELVAPETPLADALGFPEFQRLPPLRPHESGFAPRAEYKGFPPHGEEVLVSYLLREALPQVRTIEGFSWVTAPPGSGKSLAVRYLQAHPELSVEALQVETIEAALVHDIDDIDVVVEVERPTHDDIEPLSIFRGRPRSGIVLAPFPIPLEENRKGSIGVAWGWSCRHLGPFLPWRSAFAEWVVGRIASRSQRGVRFTLQDLLKWLDENDPSGRIIASPGDLLALTADFDAHGIKRTSLSKRAERWLQDIGLRNAGEHVPEAWIKRLARRTYSDVVDAQFRDLRFSLKETGEETWEAFVPSGTAPRKRRGQLDAPLVVSAFREAGLLRHEGPGLVPYPRWVAQGCLEASLAKDFDKAPEVWGTLASDRSRSHAIDAALDRLPSGSFRRLVRSVVERFDIASLGRRSALEAAFASAARRLRAAGHVDPRDVEYWQRMIILQLEHVEHREGRTTPYTRRRSDEFLADAWTLSVDVPAGVLPETVDEWLAPGWSSSGLSLGSLPLGASYQVHGDGVFDPLYPARRLCEIGPKVVALLRVQELPEQIPNALLPALLADVTRDWQLRPHHLVGLGSDTFEEGEVRRFGEALEGEQRATMASRIWGLLQPQCDCVVGRIEHLTGSLPRLAPFVLSHVSAATVCETVRSAGLHVGQVGNSPAVERPARELLHLNAEAMAAAIEEWNSCPRPTPQWTEAKSLMQILGVDHVDLVLRLLDDCDDDTAIQFAHFVWTHDPSTARDEVEASSASHWFWSAPRSELPFVAGCLPDPTPTWAKRWAYMKAPEAGAAAEKLYELSMVGEAR